MESPFADFFLPSVCTATIQSVVCSADPLSRVFLLEWAWSEASHAFAFRGNHITCWNMCYHLASITSCNIFTNQITRYRQKAWHPSHVMRTIPYTFPYKPYETHHLFSSRVKHTLGYSYHKSLASMKYHVIYTVHYHLVWSLTSTICRESLIRCSGLPLGKEGQRTTQSLWRLKNVVYKSQRKEAQCRGKALIRKYIQWLEESSFVSKTWSPATFFFLLSFYFFNFIFVLLTFKKL